MCRNAWETLLAEENHLIPDKLRVAQVFVLLTQIEQLNRNCVDHHDNEMDSDQCEMNVFEGARADFFFFLWGMKCQQFCWVNNYLGPLPFGGKHVFSFLFSFFFQPSCTRLVTSRKVDRTTKQLQPLAFDKVELWMNVWNVGLSCDKITMDMLFL